MQKILSIDFSNVPIAVTVNTVSNKDISVNEVLYIDVNKENFFNSIVEDRLAVEEKNIIIEKLKNFTLSSGFDSLNAIVILPPINQISMNLKLPFVSVPKHVDKIILNEVQDILPMPTDGLHLQYQPLKKVKGSSELMYHVNLLSENIVKNILYILKKADIDPFIIATPTGVLGVASHLAKDYFTDDSMIIDIWGDFIHLLYIKSGGTQIHERSLPLHVLGHAVSQEDLISQIRITLRDFEKEAESEILKIYYGNNISEAFASKIGKETSAIDLYQFIISPLDRKPLSYSAISSFLVQDSMPYTLNNFRSGRFDCVVHMQEVVKILKKFLPMCILFIVVFIASIVTYYFIRERRVEDIYNGIAQVAQEKVQVSTLNNRDIIASIATSRNQLDEDLKQISSSYVVSPSKILEIVSIDLSTIKGLSLNSFEFNKTTVKLLGVVQNYEDFETLKTQLTKRSDMFKSIEASQSATRDQRINFSVKFNVNG